MAPATPNRFVKIYIGTDEHMEDVLTAEQCGQELSDDLLVKIRHIRNAVQGLRIKHFVTMRDSISCAKLIAPGSGAYTIAQALEVTCLGSLTDDQRTKVRQYAG